MKHILIVLILIGYFLFFSVTTADYARNEPLKPLVEGVLTHHNAPRKRLYAKSDYGVAPQDEILAISSKVAHETGVNENTISRIMWAESHYEINARHYNTNGTIDYSLFQINSCHKKEAEAMGLDLRNPYDNAQFAIYLILHEGLSPWSASKSAWNVI